MRSLRRLFVPMLVIAALAAVPAAGFAQEGVRHVEGTIGPGSLYEMDVPPNWHGGLVLFAHGIVQADRPILPPSEQDGYNTLRGALLSNGYAVAASSFSSNGWAVDDGVRRTHQVGQLFASKFGQPRQVLLAGLSLGSLVAIKLAETYPGQYDGAFAMCGPLGGGIPEIQYAGDARVTFDAFFPGVLPGKAFEVPPGTEFYQGSDLYNRVLAEFAADPAKAVQWVVTARLPYNPSKWPTDPDGGMFASALYFIGFQLRYTNDFIERVNGKTPYDNSGTTYLVPADEATNTEVNTNVARYRSDPAAINYYERNYEPTGDLRFPVVTLHTAWDPGVPIWHEDLFAKKVADAGNAERLTQFTAPRWGHCAFRPEDIAGALGAFLQKVNAAR